MARLWGRSPLGGGDAEAARGERPHGRHKARAALRRVRGGLGLACLLRVRVRVRVWVS